MTSAALTDTASGKNRETENFPVGSLLIRPDLRAHVHAFYNFARAADDISDHPLLEPEDQKSGGWTGSAEVLLENDDSAEDIPVPQPICGVACKPKTSHHSIVWIY